MLKSRFQVVLGLLLILLGLVHGKHNSKPECNVQAWVRAPDLAPNTVIQGDARVKISAECPAIESVSLGLRFKERSFMKALRSREDLKWLERHLHHMKGDIWDPSAWTSTPASFANKTTQDAYEEIVAKKDRWIVREEERTVFETTQPFQGLESGNNGALLDAVQDFVILIPSTNFPPALDVRNFFLRLPRDNEEIRNVEWMYEYFAQVSFMDGTLKEVSAGLTAFRSLHNPGRAPRGLTSAIMELESSRSTEGKFINSPPVPVAKYSVEISTDDGLMFSAGTNNQVITAIITRTGPAREFSAPLDISFCLESNLSDKWATEYGISASSRQQNHMPTSVLRATPYSGNPLHHVVRPLYSCPRSGDPKVAVVMPNSTQDEIRAHAIVTTSSEPFTVSIDVDGAHIFDFEMSYQTLANLLTARFPIGDGEGGLADPEGLSAEHDLYRGHQFEDDEEEWVPWPKRPKSPRRVLNSYTGRVPVVVRSADEVGTLQDHLCASMDGSGQAVLSDERSCSRPSLAHYLDEGARGPVFVDRSIAHEFIVQDPRERELLAPVLEPATTSPPQGEERVYRYYRPSSPGKELIYVGETWAKKLANKNKGGVSSKTRGPHP